MLDMQCQAIDNQAIIIKLNISLSCAQRDYNTSDWTLIQVIAKINAQTR